jgi:hypothetical protein
MGAQGLLTKFGLVLVWLTFFKTVPDLTCGTQRNRPVTKGVDIEWSQFAANGGERAVN